MYHPPQANPAAVESSQHFPWFPEDPVHLFEPDSPPHRHSFVIQEPDFVCHSQPFPKQNIWTWISSRQHEASLPLLPQSNHSDLSLPAIPEDMDSIAGNVPGLSVRSLSFWEMLGVRVRSTPEDVSTIIVFAPSRSFIFLPLIVLHRGTSGIRNHDVVLSCSVWNWSSNLRSVLAGFELRPSPKKKQVRIVPRLPIAKPLRPASTLCNSYHQIPTLSCTSVLIIKPDQNAGSSLFCCSSAATVPQRSCTRLGAHLYSGMLPSCSMRMQALMRQIVFANWFAAGSTPIRY